MIKFLLINIIHCISAPVLFVLISTDSFGQAQRQRINFNEVYNTEIKRLLVPQNGLDGIIAVYLVHPEIDPDYSICLKDSLGQSYLEMRSLDKNINIELQTRFFQHKSLPVDIKTFVHSIPVSKKLKNELIHRFSEVCPEEQDPNFIHYYDGETYELIWVIDGKIETLSITYELKSGTYEYNLINQLALLNSEIKKNLFKESNYIKRFSLKRLNSNLKNNKHQQN